MSCTPNDTTVEESITDSQSHMHDSDEDPEYFPTESGNKDDDDDDDNVSMTKKSWRKYK